MSSTKAKKMSKPAEKASKSAGATSSAAKGKESAAPAKDKAAETSAKSADKSAESGAPEKGKSARESIGGADGVHYGYFSSVRTPAYRSGWDAIWGKSNGGATGGAAPTKRRTAKKAHGPVTLSLNIEDFPPELREELAVAARRAFKKRRMNYDRYAKAGSVDWRIECRIDR